MFAEFKEQAEFPGVSLPTYMKSDQSARKPRKLSRRNLLELAGWTIGAAAFPSPPD
jgi:hypothetical protein